MLAHGLLLQQQKETRSSGVELYFAAFAPARWEPTILEGVTPEMTCFGQETFGPVVSLYRFHDEADAVARAIGLDEARGDLLERALLARCRKVLNSEVDCHAREEGVAALATLTSSATLATLAHLRKPRAAPVKGRRRQKASTWPGWGMQW